MGRPAALGAFLADLDASFACDANWDRNCAVLVDNADAALAMFVGEFTEALAMRRDNRLADPPLTVIAASREELVRRALPAGGKPVPVQDAGLADYQRRLPDHKVANRGWYALRLPSLTEIETRNLVAGRGRIINVHGRPTNELLAPVIFQFTGGHPEATNVIVAELTGSADPADLETVLTKAAGELPAARARRWRAAAGRGLAGRVADRRVQRRCHPEPGDLLGSPGPGRRVPPGQRPGPEAACSPGRWPPAATCSPVSCGASRRRASLRSPGRSSCCPCCGGFLLRRLASSPDNWTKIFSWLKVASAQGGHPDAELYYALALAEIDLVARRLAARLSPQLTEDGAIGWLACWHAVTAAPRPVPAADSRAIPQLVSWADPNDEPTASVAALVAARWLLANSLRAGDLRALRREIAASLDTVARFAGVMGAMPSARKREGTAGRRKARRILSNGRTHTTRR